jgi:UPF0716 protein FxsA
MPFLLVALFILVPIAELAVIIQVGQAIGVWWTILLLIADSILGSLLMRSQGRAAWRRFNAAVREGRVPAREVADGVMVIFGGALLLTPGFITDVVGLLFLLPPTRALIRRVFLRQAMKRITVSMATAPMPPRNGHRPGDVEGTAVDVDPRQGGRPGLES